MGQGRQSFTEPTKKTPLASRCPKFLAELLDKSKSHRVDHGFGGPPPKIGGGGALPIFWKCGLTCLGAPVVPFYRLFMGEGSPTKIDYRKKLFFGRLKKRFFTLPTRMDVFENPQFPKSPYGCRDV